MLGHLVLALFRLVHHDSQIWVIEWQSGGEHGIENYAHAPDVCLVTTVLSVLEEFRSRIMGATACSGKLVGVSLMQGSHAKVGNLDLVIGGDQNILRLQVAVADVKGVTIRDCANHLSKEIDRDFLSQSSSGINKSKEVALIDILEN